MFFGGALLARLLSGQVIVAGLFCSLAVSAVGLLLCGFLLLRIPSAPLIALLTALVDALPVLGTGTVLLPWALVSLLGGGAVRALGLLGLYVCAALVRSVLEPRLVGSHLGLDPLVTLIAMYCGYRLWGLAGMLLLPLVAATVFQALPEEK